MTNKKWLENKDEESSDQFDITEPSITPQTKNEEPVAERPRAGPFGTDVVDRLVFAQPSDSPELRAAAANVPRVGSIWVPPTPAPSKPRTRDYAPWTPGNPLSSGRIGQVVESIPSWVRSLAGVVVVSLPLALIFFVVKFAINLYR
jgi:hypothetical protein